MSIRNALRLLLVCILAGLAGACAGPAPLPDEAEQARLRSQREERQRYEAALREERQRHEAALREEQRRHERSLRECQKRAEELQKKIDGLVAIELDLRRKEGKQP